MQKGLNKMQGSRTVNATRNIFWGVIDKVAYILIPFVLRTVFIRVLGAQYLGLNSLFTSILSVLNITELGFGSAISFSMYKPIAHNDNDTICALLSLFKKIYRVVGCTILTLGLLLIPWLSLLIEGEYPADINIYILYLIFLLDTVLGYFLFSYKEVLFLAHQRNDLMSKLSVVINIIGNIVKLIMLVSFKNYYMYIIVGPISIIVRNLLNEHFSRKFFPQIVCRGTVSSEEKGEIKKRVKGLLSYKIYGTILNSVDAIVISAVLGLVPLAKYNNYYYIQTAIVGFMSIVSSSMVAGIGNKMVINSKEDNYKDFNNIMFANAWLSGWCSICLFCLYQHFMKIWVGEEMLFPLSTVLLMTFYFLVPRISSVTYTYREASGMWWEDRFRPLIAAITNLTLNLILVRYIGINGVIISTVFCTVFINIPWGSYILFKKYFEMRSLKYYLKLLYYILITIIIGAITYLLLTILPNYGIDFLIVKAVICAIVPNLLFLAVYHKLPEFKYFKGFLFRTFKLKK